MENIINNNKLFWQYPVITEQTFYEQNKDDINYFGFPWATCIDKGINTNDLARLLLPVVDKNKKYYTCCQHISFKKYISLFKILGIITIYSSHKIKNQNEIDNIKILPCPLYACNFEDTTRNAEFRDKNFSTINRKYLYSFVGGVQSCYLTNIRNNLFTMKHPVNTIVQNTGDWHFNKVVYSQYQNHKRELNINVDHILKTKKYNEILLDSRYSLCPSGSGPNSIRFWESLACGAIPILLSDTLDLPYNINWKEIIIIIREAEYENIPRILSNISVEEENFRRQKCCSIYNELKNNFKNICMNK